MDKCVDAVCIWFIGAERRVEEREGKASTREKERTVSILDPDKIREQ